MDFSLCMYDQDKEMAPIVQPGTCLCLDNAAHAQKGIEKRGVATSLC